MHRRDEDVSVCSTSFFCPHHTRFCAEHVGLLLEFVVTCLSKGATFTAVAHELGLPRTTLRRRLTELGWTGVYDKSTTESLEEVISTSLKPSGRDMWCGIRHVQSFLQTCKGLRVGRGRVRNALATVAPSAMEARLRHSIVRRIFGDLEPMDLWAMDSE